MSDVVRANLAAAGRRGFGIFNGSTTETSRPVPIYEKICEALGGDVEPRFGPAKPGEQRRSSVDPGRLHSELGIADLSGLDAGLAATAAWFRARHQAST